MNAQNLIEQQQSLHATMQYITTAWIDYLFPSAYNISMWLAF